jgi:hypothetical protein
MNDKYIVKITKPNFILNFRGKVVRSPVEIIAFERELKLIKIQCKRAGIVPEIHPHEPNFSLIFDDVPETKETIIEELYKEEPPSILNKLLNNEKIELEKK